MVEPKFTLKVEQGNIIKGVITGGWVDSKDSEEQAKLLFQAVEKILKDNQNKQFKLYGDIRVIEQYQEMYLKERIWYVKLMTLKQIRKVVLVSDTLFFTKMVKVLWSLTGKNSKNMDVFKDEKKAWEWLLED